MENLIKDFKKEKSESSLEKIYEFLKETPVKNYIQNMSELISQILSTTGLEEIKWKILTYILDLFLTLQIPSDQIQSAGIERIFSSEYPLYTTNNSDMHSSFFNYYYPNGEYLSSLKFPQQVDFLYECNKKNYFYEWVRGTATSIEEDKKYNFVQDETNKEFCFKTTNIQPYKSMTDDFEWRFSLKKGDEIDYLDTSKTWYLSTVLERNNNTVKIGLRKYRENGNQTDEKGQKYFGWNEKFDIECSIFCARIQKPEKFSKKIINHTSDYYPISGRGYNSFQVIAPYNPKEIFVIPKLVDQEQSGDLSLIHI